VVRMGNSVGCGDGCHGVDDGGVGGVGTDMGEVVGGTGVPGDCLLQMHTSSLSPVSPHCSTTVLASK
jgi:hypothetical protein